MREEACVIVSQWDAPIKVHWSKGAREEERPERRKLALARRKKLWRNIASLAGGGGELRR